MALFYKAISMVLWYIGSSLASSTIAGYTPPQFPVSVVLAAASGPFEEVIFFGMPYYLTSNPLVVLASASVWSVAHLFSTNAISLSSLAYGNFLLSIPHVFFGLRTWSSGKGWFAIVFHSAWNVSILLSYCGMGIRACTAIGTGDSLLSDILTMSAAATSVLFVYQLYKNKTQKINRTVTLLLLAGLAVSVILLTAFNVVFLV